MTRSGRDCDNSEARVVSRSSSDFVSAESFRLTLRVSSDMIVIDHEEKCLNFRDPEAARTLRSNLTPLYFLSITRFQKPNHL